MGSRTKLADLANADANNRPGRPRIRLEQVAAHNRRQQVDPTTVVGAGRPESCYGSVMALHARRWLAGVGFRVQGLAVCQLALPIGFAVLTMFIEELCGMLVHPGPQRPSRPSTARLLRLGGVGGRSGHIGFEQRTAYVGDVHDAD